MRTVSQLWVSKELASLILHVLCELYLSNMKREHHKAESEGYNLKLNKPAGI